ncbi:ATP-binding protein [Kitasatospora sp. SolWspMP-SS2h]|uniref:ATP-binding protein n=1 Tax=Kitasatospora sp. SolWspMP-SS2h TaxID=1305729 RepID=UPI001F350F82|nr:ATP-binding protein [Kitasatospora sp. SolWspMP-SS2h]
MVARAVPVQAGSTSSAMAVPHGPASVSAARRRLRGDLGDRSLPEAVIDDAVLILSELLSNSCRHARPLEPVPDTAGGAVGGAVGGTAGGTGIAADEAAESGTVLVSWQMCGDGLLTLEVTDGGASTRPIPARPSVTARGGRGLSIVGELAQDWGVRHAPGQVTVWAQLSAFGQVAGGGRRRSA